MASLLLSANPELLAKELVETPYREAPCNIEAEQDFLRRWSNALGLLAPGGGVHQGRGMIVGDPEQAIFRTLVAWNQPTQAERSLRARSEARLPPAWVTASVTGGPEAVAEALSLLSLPKGTEQLDMHLMGAEDGVLLRAPRTWRAALAGAFAEMARLRSARKLDPVRVQLDVPVT